MLRARETREEVVAHRGELGATQLAEERHALEAQPPRVDDVRGVDPRDVADDHVRRVHGVARHEPVRRQQRVQLAAEEEIDAHEQDRRHVQNVSSWSASGLSLRESSGAR